ATSRAIGCCPPGGVRSIPDAGRPNAGLPRAWRCAPRLPRAWWPPAAPRDAHQRASSVETAGACTPSPSASAASLGLAHASERAVALAGSVVPWGRFTWCVWPTGLLSRDNTREEGWVRPDSTGTGTLQEAPSEAWRTNARAQLLLEAAATQ